MLTVDFLFRVDTLFLLLGTLICLVSLLFFLPALKHMSVETDSRMKFGMQNPAEIMTEKTRSGTEHAEWGTMALKNRTEPRRMAKATRSTQMTFLGMQFIDKMRN
jgi:hypothetical protein